MRVERMLYERHMRQEAIDALRKYNESRKEWLNSIGVNPSKDAYFSMIKSLISCFIAENEAITKAIQEENVKEREAMAKMMRNNSNKFGGQNI